MYSDNDPHQDYRVIEVLRTPPTRRVNCRKTNGPINDQQKGPNPVRCGKRKVDEITNFQLPPAKKAKMSLTTLNDRIKPNGGMLDTGKALVSNPFKDRVAIQKAQITGIEIFFDNIHNNIISVLRNIYQHYGSANIYILGCVAWLSDTEIITCLAEAAGVQLLVNDEDFASWGGGNIAKDWYSKLSAIKHPFSRIFKNCPNKLLVGLDPKQPQGGNLYYAAVRSIGTRPIKQDTIDDIFKRLGSNATNTSQSNSILPKGTNVTELQPTKKTNVFQSGPILHAKYLIPCKWMGNGKTFQPLGLFTGSMNLTKKSRKNQENVLWIESEAAGNAYLDDYVRSFIASQPIRNK